MNKFIQVNISDDFKYHRDVEEYKDKLDMAREMLSKNKNTNSNMAGWLDIDSSISRLEYEKLKRVWDYFKDNFEKVVVIGIWWSYLWAKAVIESLKSNFKEGRVIFAWFNLDSNYLWDLLEYLWDKNYGVIVISKSGTTLEPMIGFRFLLDDLLKKYHIDDVTKRVVVITDKETWRLRDIATKYNFETFDVPDNIWWRYSVFTPVWLLPIYIAGVDIDQILSWVCDMKKHIENTGDIYENPSYLYAITRNILYDNDIKVEVLSNFDMRFKYIAEWWKQLFAESEWKDHRWILPISLNYTTDLHSVGQYIQDWSRIFFETFLSVGAIDDSPIIPNIIDYNDWLDEFIWRNIGFLNRWAYFWTKKAHVEWWVGVIEISIPEINPYYIWQLLYFFLVSWAISAYMLWVNPFDQPWVERYKKYSKNYLKT